jgi:hypothetical protein
MKNPLSHFVAERSNSPLTMNEYLYQFQYQGLNYSIPFPTQSLGGQPQEELPATFDGLVQGAFRSNGVVFACMMVRMLLFSEARFQFRERNKGRPGDLFGTEDLEILEKPWAGGTTGDLLTRMIQDVDLAGNFFGTREGKLLFRLRPDWVTIVLGSKTMMDEPGFAYDTEVAGYLYHPGGHGTGKKPQVFLPEQVAHFAPIPDPIFRFRGLSWLVPVINEILADGAATTHKLKFFENGATPNLVVSLDPEIQKETFEKWIEAFETQQTGVLNAYKTLYLGAGAKVDVVGANLQQIAFKDTQGHGETRIAAAAGVPPVLVGLSEGLKAATYSNYQQARRRFADGTMRPLWRNAAGSLARIVPAPGTAELWYDDRDIPFLAEDVMDAAEVQSTDATAMKTLIEAGYDPDSVTEAITSGDLKLLKHSNLVSVQLQKPGQNGNQPDKSQTNGKPELPVPAA